MNSESNLTPLRRLLSVKELSALYRWPTGGLRQLIFRAKVNGLEKALVRVGRKVLVDESKFVEWIDVQSKSQRQT